MSRATDTPPTTWAPLTLDDVLDGGATGPEPALLARSDGRDLLYPGELHAAIGEPESGKGWLALLAAFQVLAAGRHVLYIDFEDSAPNVIGRLLALGADADVIRGRFAYSRPDEPLTPRAWADLEPALAAHPDLAVLDGLTEAFTLQGLDPDSNRQAAEWLTLVPRRIVAATGAAVLLIDHVAKAREGRGRYAIGAQHKLAGVAAGFALEVIEPLGRGRDGTAKVSVVKDRHGRLREHAEGGKRIALMRVSSTGEHVTVTLDPPDAEAGDGGTFRPTILMERVSRAVEQEPGLSARAIRAAVKGRNDVIDLALELLAAEGHVEVRRDGQARRHHTLRPFRTEHDQGHRAPPRPDRAPGTVEGTVPAVPPPSREGTRGTDPPEANGHGPPCPDPDAELERLQRKGLA